MLNKIFNDLMEIGQGLCMGTVDFELDDPLYAALSAGHPVEAYSYIVEPVYNKFILGKVTKADLYSMMTDLESFADELQVSELEKPVEELRKYIYDMPQV